jgi:hypothetical protein
VTTDIATTDPHRGALVTLTPEQEAAAEEAKEALILHNDIGKLLPKQRIGYVLALCRAHGLDPLTQPFLVLLIDGRHVLYPTAKCAEQIRRRHQISPRLVRKERVGDLWCVEVEGRRPNGTSDFATKYVSLRDRDGKPLAGQKLADALHKCETGAKRRLTFSMVAIPGVGDEDGPYRRVWMAADGTILEHPTEEQKYLIDHPRSARIAGYRTITDEATPDDSPVGVAQQTPTADELARPRRPDGPAPTFKPSAEDVRRYLGAWFASVKGTSLDDDDARHRFVRQWTAQYPEGIRTESLRDFFEHATERQAGDLLAHVRVIAEEERAAAAGTQEDLDEEERPF